MNSEHHSCVPMLPWQHFANILSADSEMFSIRKKIKEGTSRTVKDWIRAHGGGGSFSDFSRSGIDDKKDFTDVFFVDDENQYRGDENDPKGSGLFAKMSAALVQNALAFKGDQDHLRCFPKSSKENPFSKAAAGGLPPAFDFIALSARMVTMFPLRSHHVKQVAEIRNIRVVEKEEDPRFSNTHPTETHISAVVKNPFLPARGRAVFGVGSLVELLSPALPGLMHQLQSCSSACDKVLGRCPGFCGPAGACCDTKKDSKTQPGCPHRQADARGMTYVWVDGRTRGVPYVPGSGEALTPEDNNAEAYQEIVEQEDTPAYRGISPGQAPTGVVAQDTIRNVYLRGEDLSAEGVKDDQHIPVDVGEKDHFTHPLAYVEDLPTLYVDIKVGDRIRHAIPRGAMGIYHNEWSGAETGRYEYLSGAVSKQLQTNYSRPVTDQQTQIRSRSDTWHTVFTNKCTEPLCVGNTWHQHCPNRSVTAR